jgi:hypothetical protein
MPENPVDDSLITLLRAGDPAAGDPGLSPAERAVMRQRVLAAGRDRHHLVGGWLLPAATVVALLALALGLAWRQPQTAIPGPATDSPPPVLASRSSGQQIQFTTDSGTLVVWVLQPRPTS